MPINPLMPQQGQEAAGPAGAGLGQGDDPLAQLSLHHDGANAQLKKLDSMTELMRKTRGELDSLVSLGDLVEDEDVIRAVGKIVAAGGAPMPLATMLADAPFGNREALQSWIASKDANIRQIEAQMSAAQQQARHAVGLAGLRLLAGHAVQGLARPEQEPPASPQPQPEQAPQRGDTADGALGQSR